MRFPGCLVFHRFTLPELFVLLFHKSVPKVSPKRSKLNLLFYDLGMKVPQSAEKKHFGRPRRSDANLLLAFEALWVETLRGLRDGSPEVETTTLAGTGMFIKRSGEGPEQLYIERAGEKTRVIRQPKFDTTPDEKRRWRSRVQEEQVQFEQATLHPAPVRVRVPAIPSERRLWEALKRAKTSTQVRRIYSRSKVWLKPRLEFPDGGFIEHWPFRRVLYREAERFCRSKLDPRYPSRDQRKSGDYRRVEYLARVMAGLTVRLAPTTAVEMLRKMKHQKHCHCWRCLRRIAPRYRRSLAHLLAHGDWFR
jgi:hypothetical protein